MLPAVCVTPITSHSLRRSVGVVSGGGNTERYRLQDDTLRFLVPVTETDEAEKRTVELVLKRES